MKLPLIYLFIALLTVPTTFAQKKILVVLSSADRLPLSQPKSVKSISTGYFLVELAEMLQRFEKKGYEFDFATPGGKTPTLDINGLDLAFYLRFSPAPHLVPRGKIPQKSLNRAFAKRLGEIETAWIHLNHLKFSNPLPKSNKEAVKFAELLKAAQAKHQFPRKKFKSLKELNYHGVSDDYAAIFIPGGHAPMVDLKSNPQLGDILVDFNDAKKFIFAICHGPIALLSARFSVGSEGERVLRSGPFPFRGKTITTVSKFEELIVLKTNYPKVPGHKTRLKYFVNEALEKEMKVEYDVGVGLGLAKVVADGHLVTANGPQAMTKLIDKMESLLTQ